MQALQGGRRAPPAARDRGPVRKYARDLVDTRRSVAEFFLPLALVILALTFFGSARMKLFGSSLWLALVVLIVVDSRCSRSGCAAACPKPARRQPQGRAALRADAQHADPPLPAAGAADQGATPPQP